MSSQTFFTASGKKVPVVVAAAKKTYPISAKEREIVEKYIKSLCLSEAVGSSVIHQERPIAVALVGRIGARRSEVAADLARELRGIVINDLAIRRMSGNCGDYLSDARIAACVALTLLASGINIVLSGDHVYEERRGPLLATAEVAGAQVTFIRVFADDRVFFEKMKEPRHTKKDVIELSEQFYQQTTRHYAMPNDSWALRELPFRTEIVVETTTWDDKRAQQVFKIVVPLLLKKEKE